MKSSSRLLLAPLVAAACLTGCGGSAKPAQKSVPPFQHFRSRPNLKPPVITVLTPAHDTAPGYVFLGPKKKVVQAGPMILDDQGQVVWFRALDTHAVTDFRVQHYRGRPVLTWWRGRSTLGVGDGNYVIVDDSYHRIAIVRAGHGLVGDVHEFLITPSNTALFTAYRRVKRDLTALGGAKHAVVWDGVVQEVDIATHRVVFEWHSIDHVRLDESYMSPSPPGKPAKEPYDYFHVNAIDVDTDGNLLVSARHTHTIYKIRKSDGAILWRLGGKRSDFKMGAGTEFAWQHDARREADGTITLFDNGASQPKKGAASRVLVLRVNTQSKRVSLVRSYVRPGRLLSTSQGDAQFLPDGHVFVGWGSNPYFTEFDRAGHVLFDASFDRESDSYRAYRFPWVGHPSDRPAIAVDRGKHDATVFASWNGATQVASWRVRTGSRRHALHRVANEPRNGFETSIPVHSSARYYQVDALDANGRPLGSSRVVKP